MKKIILLIATVLFAGCEQQRYFSSASEIDLIKQGNAAYLSGDWEKLRSFYADTAKILINKWFGEEITVDQFIEMEKAEVANFTSYSIGDDGIYEMVITDSGQRWVHAWFLWSATLKSGKIIRTPVHLSMQVVNGKVVYQGALFDNLPGFLATQMPGDSLVAGK